MALQRINHPRIKRSLAASLHELALILGPAITATDLLPFFYQYLEDTPEIREKAMANLPVFVANLHGSGGTSTDLREVKEAVELVEVLSKLWSDGFFSNWHEREVLAGQTSRLLEVFVSTASDSLQDTRAPLRIADEASAEDAANGSLELLRSGLVDTFAAVRDAAVANVRVV
jgi:serine/threonine-protein phosphatase 4 regulatory subunit 1